MDESRDDKYMKKCIMINQWIICNVFTTTVFEGLKLLNWNNFDAQRLPLEIIMSCIYLLLVLVGIASLKVSPKWVIAGLIAI